MSLRCFAYSFSRELTIKSLYQYLSDNYNLKKFDDILHINIDDKDIDKDEGDVFIFSYGTIVCWGLTKDIEDKICRILEKFLGSKLGEVDDDLYSYGYGEEIGISEDHITLLNNDTQSKLACSYGLAQSAKLGGFEETIQKIIDNTKELPEQLAEDGTINLSRGETRKLMGRIFIDRSSINLHLKLLDVPNFFWDHTDLEPLYEMITEYTTLRERVNILNKQLNVMHELLEMLANELNNQHSSKLEWIIILLIFVEIVIILIKDVFNLI